MDKNSLNKKAPVRVGLKILLFATIYLGLGFACAYLVIPSYTYPVVWLVQGAILVGTISLCHDASHVSLLESPKTNRLIGVLFSLPILQSFTAYQTYHLAHHAHVGTPEDTEPVGEFESVWDYMLGFTGIFFIQDMFGTMVNALRDVFPDYVKRTQDKKRIKYETVLLLLFLLAIVTMTVFYPYQLLCLYWAPLLVYYPGMIFTGLPEHYGCSVTQDPLINTRSVKAHPLFCFLYWNGNYHAEHHLYPSMPSIHYPALANKIGSTIKYSQHSYFYFHRNLLLAALKNTFPTHEERPV